MPGLDLTAIRQGLADTVAGGTVREIQGYAYPKGDEQLPCVVVHTADEYFDPWGTIAADGGTAVINFVLEFMAPARTTFEDGLRILDEMMSSGFDAIQADRSLGGVVDETLLGVSSGQSGTRLEDGRPTAVVCRWPLTVWKQRS
jgi:hypothetical protein